MLTIEIRFIAHSSWRPVMLYDGDSLTFPILWKSLLHGEARGSSIRCGLNTLRHCTFSDLTDRPAKVR